MALFYELVSDQAISIMIAGVGFFALLASSWRYRARRGAESGICAVVGSSEFGSVFSYMTEDAENGQVTTGALLGSMIWVFILFAFFLYSIEKSSVPEEILPDSYNVGVRLVGVVCFLSCAYASNHSFRGWIYKVVSGNNTAGACESSDHRNSQRLEKCF